MLLSLSCLIRLAAGWFRGLSGFGLSNNPLIVFITVAKVFPGTQLPERTLTQTFPSLPIFGWKMGGLKVTEGADSDVGYSVRG